jgi:hypothetical protein
MLVKIEQIKANPKNPRVLKDSKYNSLKKSLEDFPEMLEKRPLVVFTDKDGKFVVLGGNMRFKVAKELGFKELPIILADDWTEEQKTQFLIKDNVNYGDWDWDALANEWDSLELKDWGLDIPNFNIEEIDYSILEDENLDAEINDMHNGVKKAIQIEFELGDYAEAQELIKILREKEIYIGGIILEALRKTK